MRRFGEWPVSQEESTKKKKNSNLLEEGIDMTLQHGTGLDMTHPLPLESVANPLLGVPGSGNIASLNQHMAETLIREEEQLKLAQELADEIASGKYGETGEPKELKKKRVIH